MRLHLLSGFGFGALALVLAAGCGGGQTGDLSGKGDRTDQKVGHENSGGCDEQRAEIDFDEETEAGTAEELLAYAERTFEAPLAWKTAGQGQSWSAGPESGTGTMELSVMRGAKAYLLTYTQPQNTSGQEIHDAGLICPPPRVGVEATVTLTSGGGALAESFDTLLRAEAPGVAMLNVPFELNSLAGELSVETSNPNAKLVQLGFDAVLTAAGMTGSISGFEEVRSGSGPDGTVGASKAVLAVWPGDEACGGGEGLSVPLEQSVLGVSGEGALVSVTPAEAVPVQWRDGSTTTLDVGITSTGAGCFRVSDSPVPGDGGPLTTYPVSVTLQSADGKLDGTYVGQVEVRGSDVTASATLTLEAADVDQSGFASVSLPTGTESVALQFEAEPGSGHVRLVAMSGSPCALQSSGSGEGMSSPPCAGATITQVETASWGD